MTKRPFQKKHLIQVFVGVGVGLLIMAGADLVISSWPGLILVGLGGIIAIAEPRRQTVADWIVRWTGRLPKMSISLFLKKMSSISLFLVGGGVGLLIIEFSGIADNVLSKLEEHLPGGNLMWLGLLLIGLGGVWALFELLADTIDGFLNKAYPPSKSSGIKTILPVKGTFRSHDPETGKARSRWGTWTALLIFGLIAYNIWSFLNWLPGPI